jgi:hypothetical protein
LPFGRFISFHDPDKGDKPLGQAARGSGALLDHVGISIDMRHPSGDLLILRRYFQIKDDRNYM